MAFDEACWCLMKNVSVYKSNLVWGLGFDRAVLCLMVDASICCMLMLVFIKEC